MSGRFHAIIMHFTNENFKKITDQSKLEFRGCFNLKLYRAWHQFGPRRLKMSQKQYLIYNTYNSDMIWMGFLPQLDHKAVTRGLKEYGQISHEYFFRFWWSLVYILNAQELKWNIHKLKDIAVLISVRDLREHVTFGVNFSDDGRVTHSVSVLFSCFALFYSCFEIVFLLSNNISQTQFYTAQSISFHQSTLLIRTNVFDVGVICQFFFM